MPRRVKINRHPNPTGLTMQERELAISVVQSIRDALAQSRKDVRQRNSYWRPEWTAEMEQQALERVCRAAVNQFAGNQKSEAGIFKLHYDADVQDEDMEYIRRSLGVS